jgi:hypothetical protein
MIAIAAESKLASYVARFAGKLIESVAVILEFHALAASSADPRSGPAGALCCALSFFCARSVLGLSLRFFCHGDALPESVPRVNYDRGIVV